MANPPKRDRSLQRIRLPPPGDAEVQVCPGYIQNFVDERLGDWAHFDGRHMEG